ncbi:MAG: YkgJ family cysteine cluster protein [Candidatus Dormibacteria bacterium]
MSRLDAIWEARTLDELYDLIPDPLGCSGACEVSCGAIGFSVEEGRRLEAAGAHIPNVNDLRAAQTGPSQWCSALVEGRCGVYEVRPSVCRIWGVSEPLPCPFVGCHTLYPLSTEETEAVSKRALEIGGLPGLVERRVYLTGWTPR